MAERRAGRDVVIVGGAIAALLLLFRGSGWGPSHSGDGWLGFGDSTSPRLLWILVRAPAARGDNFFVGSSLADARSRAGMTLSAAVAQAKQQDARVTLHATGDARQGDIDELQRRLAGVYVSS